MRLDGQLLLQVACWPLAFETKVLLSSSDLAVFSSFFSFKYTYSISVTRVGGPALL